MLNYDLFQHESCLLLVEVEKNNPGQHVIDLNDPNDDILLHNFEINV